jgi:CarD family transcriptional regulator
MEQHLGDKIVHPVHGAGVVREVRSTTRDRSPRTVYVIEFIGGGLEMYAPLTETLPLRPAVCADKLPALAAILASAPQPLPEQAVLRRILLAARLKTLQAHKLAELVRDLSAFALTHSSFRIGDSKILTQAQKLLITEWALVAGLSLTMAKSDIERALQGSMKATKFSGDRRKR